ncbi:hypothetical protein [Pedobacter sp. L105]|uniref:hypothetical protein n=1 Tax=Pedobacter sp. L105 TaxID=1641871 RepID=UPI00131CD7D3|nr:hypothetical protein [Pedobacter sp. L105]
MDSPNEIKSRHIGDLTTLWKIYQSDERYYKDVFFKVSLWLTVILFLGSVLSHLSAYLLIQHIIGSITSIIPNLLGFSLGAYILIVGFGSTEILAVITRPLKGQQNFSLYQKLNSVFGITVIFQIFTLLFAFVVSFIDELLPVIYTNKSSVLYFVCGGVNLVVLFIFIFSIIYCLLMLINIIKQVFIFAQTIHFIVYLDESKKQELLNHVDISKENKIERPPSKEDREV